MKIEKYFVKKHDINRLIVIYSNNDLLLPYLKLLLKDFKTYHDPKVFMSILKKRKKQEAVVINLYASLDVPEQEQGIIRIEQLIENVFGVTIENCHAIKKLIKIHNRLNK